MLIQTVKKWENTLAHQVYFAQNVFGLNNPIYEEIEQNIFGQKFWEKRHEVNFIRKYFTTFSDEKINFEPGTKLV